MAEKMFVIIENVPMLKRECIGQFLIFLKVYSKLYTLSEGDL